MTRVLVMLSGGVDSSVAALLLKQQGYDLKALTLNLWADESGTCCGVAANCRAKDVSKKLGIEHFVLNKRMDFMKHVVDPYVDSYKNGERGNPCINCNSYIKIGGMVQYADHFDCEYIATGHYVRLIDGHIRTAVDSSKEQSYMLSRVDATVLRRFMFPLGNMLKTDVRAIAAEQEFPIPRDSQDLCFVEKEDRAEFLQARGVKIESGNIVSSSGETIGKHAGMCDYTVGQRSRLPGSNSGPLYVIRLDKNNNSVVVGQRDELLSKRCIVRDFNWQYEIDTNRVFVKTHYKDKPAQATYEKVGDKLLLTFDEPKQTAASGQAAVLYQKVDDGMILLGGGWIV